MDRLEYQRYILSDEWKIKRLEKLLEVGTVCERHDDGECRGVLVIHHKTYEHFGYEPLSDLQVLCRRHHEMEHQRHRGKRTEFNFKLHEELPQLIEQKIDELNAESFKIYDQLKALHDLLGRNELSDDQIAILRSLGIVDF